MCTVCGIKCEECGFIKQCHGCIATNGNPFGGGCVTSEYIKVGGKENYNLFKETIIKEINALHIEGLPEISELYSVCGFYVNMEYTLPNGDNIKFLNGNRIYLATQVQSIFDSGEGDRCFGIVADKDFILVSTYGVNGKEPEIVLYKHR